MTPKVGRRWLTDHPARFVVSAFLAAIVVGAGLLSLPWSTATGRDTDLVTALFMSTSAVCVTGFSTVDVGTHFSGFGQGVLLVLAQVGGLGFMTLASLIAMLVSHRLGLRMALVATAERGTLELGDVRRVLTGVAVVTLVVEVTVALALMVRFRFGYHYPWDDAVWHSVFHSVAAFNNAGFSLYPDSLNRFATDIVVTAAVMVGIMVGGLGFPVLVDLYQRRGRGWRRLSLHSRLTLTTSSLLLVVGWVMVCASEWANSETLGSRGTAGKVWMGLFGSVTARTAGFHTMTPAVMTDEGLIGTMFLMFVGAGSAGTSGGIKVATLALLVLVVLAELRGSRDVAVFGRRISEQVQRQAVTVVLLGMSVVVVTVFGLLWVTDLPVEAVAFEAVSGFGTTGLTTGVTPLLPTSGRLLMMVVMLVGRLGPVTLGTAMVFRFRNARIRFPEEAPLIG